MTIDNRAPPVPPSPRDAGTRGRRTPSLRLLDDLAGSVAEARRAGDGQEQSTPLYGLAASFPIRGAIDDMLERYLDLLYDLPDDG